MEIRELTDNDLESLLELYKQLDVSNEPLTIEASIPIWHAISANKNIKYLGAIDNNKVVSTCYLVIIPNLTNFGQPICFIENVVTDIEYRKQGIFVRRNESLKSCNNEK